jgi:hypothetical protein
MKTFSSIYYNGENEDCGEEGIRCLVRVLGFFFLCLL